MQTCYTAAGSTAPSPASTLITRPPSTWCGRSPPGFFHPETSAAAPLAGRGAAAGRTPARKSSFSAAPPEPPFGLTNPVCGSISCCGLKMNPSLVSEGSAAASVPPSPVVANGHVTESNGSSPRYSPGSSGGGRPESGGSGDGQYRPGRYLARM
jgi:hypothetical protein